GAIAATVVAATDIVEDIDVMEPIQDTAIAVVNTNIDILITLIMEDIDIILITTTGINIIGRATMDDITIDLITTIILIITTIIIATHAATGVTTGVRITENIIVVTSVIDTKKCQ